MPRRLRILDLVALLVSAGTVAALSIRAYADQGARATMVQIESPSGTYVYPLDQDRRITVTGPVGRNVIEIRGGEARVVEADCPDKICITMGAIRRPGAWVACLPNRVFLRVLGTDASTDAFSF